MEYLLLLHSNENGWAQLTPAQQQQGIAAYGAYTEALKQAGVYKGSNRLASVSNATTISVTDGKTQVLDGPYADLKEQLAGYYLIDVADLDTAISWATRCPTASHGKVEVRPIYQYAKQ